MHHTVCCKDRVSLFDVDLTMVFLIFWIDGRFANWVFRQDFFFFLVCKVKLREVSFWLLFLLLCNWLFFGLSWLVLAFNWLFVMFDWFGTMLSWLGFMLSLLR